MIRLHAAYFTLLVQKLICDLLDIVLHIVQIKKNNKLILQLRIREAAITV